MAITLVNPGGLPEVDAYRQVSIATGSKLVFIARQIAVDADGVTVGEGDLAAIVTEVTGRPVVHRRLSYEQMCDHLTAQMPLEFAAMLAGMDRAVAGGAEDRTTDVVQRLTGRPPSSFRAVVEREAARGR